MKVLLGEKYRMYCPNPGTKYHYYHDKVGVVRHVWGSVDGVNQSCSIVFEDGASFYCYTWRLRPVDDDGEE